MSVDEDMQSVLVELISRISFKGRLRSFSGDAPQLDPL